MDYPRHYEGMATLYDTEKTGQGYFPTYTVKAVLRSPTEIGIDLRAENGTRRTFTLKSLSGKFFSGHDKGVVIRRTGVLVDEENEVCHIAGKWQEEGQEECSWYAELSLTDAGGSHDG